MSLIVSQPLVKTTKTALEAHNLLDKRHKIKIHPAANECNLTISPGMKKYIIPLKDLSIDIPSDHNTKHSLLKCIGLSQYAPQIALVSRPSLPPNQSPSPDPSKTNPLTRTLTTFIRTLPSTLPDPVSTTTHTYTYTIYPPLLLLPPTTFTTPPWPPPQTLTPHLPRLYQDLCVNLAVSHIALNAPIPPLPSQDANIRRSPTAFAPLHGDFGPLVPPSRKPEKGDFEDAFWCTCRQNGIFQTWAPRYVMFSRGNVSEKARILRLPSLTGEMLGREVGESSAVDLYAGIGYFAFSYLKAGVGMVLCWEINEWSVEGLRRGARVNGWSVRDGSTEEWEGERMVFFEEDNRRAGERVRKLRRRILPIRRVNCGLLPTSEGSWGTAVEVLDPEEGGWIHAHENIGVGDIEERRPEVVAIFTELLRKDRGKNELRAECHHLERVKSYAPGVIHCVLDIYIPPMAASSITSQ